MCVCVSVCVCVCVCVIEFKLMTSILRYQLVFGIYENLNTRSLI